MRILALDLGSKTGWAYWDSARGYEVSGTWVLATDKEADLKTRDYDVRPARLKSFIESLPTPDFIFFEDVPFSTFTYQTQLWAGLRTIVFLQRLYRPVKTVAVPVGTLKKFATGKGNAQKEDMARSLLEKHGGIFYLDETPRGKQAVFTARRQVDDNEIDAWWLLQYAKAQLK